jgi:hypothetical protein
MRQEDDLRIGTRQPRMAKAMFLSACEYAPMPAQKTTRKTWTGRSTTSKPSSHIEAVKAASTFTVRLHDDKRRTRAGI